MNRKKSIVYLNRSQLEPHPDNPRKDLGDLEELRESIRQNGIMQNLTVIPTDDSYEHFRILIGHRRFAASEGILYELPCVIVEDLTDREQVGIMLCENLQRNDLTFYEQGQGFQMMLDLGDTIDQISEKTGFSKNTVKHRVEIAKLSVGNINKQKNFQLQIKDFIELERIADVKIRNKIISEAYSSENLKLRVDSAVREAKRDKNLKILKPLLKDAGIKESKDLHYRGGYEEALRIDLDKDVDSNKLLKKFSTMSGCTWEEGYGDLYIVRKLKKTKEKKLTPEEQAAKESERKIKKIREGFKDVMGQYWSFIADLPGTVFTNKAPKEQLIELNTLWDLMRELGIYFSSNGFYNIKDKELRERIDSKFVKEKMPWQMLAMIVHEIDHKDPVSWDGTPNKEAIKNNERLIDILEPYGFYIAGAGLPEIMNGSSELFAKPKSSEAKATC